MNHSRENAQKAQKKGQCPNLWFSMFGVPRLRGSEPPGQVNKLKVDASRGAELQTELGHCQKKHLLRFMRFFAAKSFFLMQ
jgi:hypothetical protein